MAKKTNLDPSVDVTTTIKITWSGSETEAADCVTNLQAALSALNTNEPNIKGCLQDFIDAFNTALHDAQHTGL
jgi:hypothetical protein